MPSYAFPNNDFSMYEDVNTFNAGQAKNQLALNHPNYLANLSQYADTTGSQLKGQLPDDLINQIGQAAAERGVANGLSPLSGNTGAAYMKAFYDNSQNQMQRGAQNFANLTQMTPTAEIFNPASLIVPTQMANQQLNAARIGQQPRSGGGGPITPPMAGGGGGYFNGGNFTNGMWNGNPGTTALSGSDRGVGYQGLTPDSELGAGWWSQYGRTPSDTGWEDAAFGNMGNGWADTSWEDMAFGGDYFQ